MSLKTLACSGQIANTGNLPILDRGFVFSTTNSYPTINDVDSTRWSVTGTSLIFTSVITGLTQATYYWVNSYATNSLGTDHSDVGTTIYVQTDGISVYPTITVNITCNGIATKYYEIGTISSLVVTGKTDKNDEDESNFVDGYLNQTSSPKATNPIKTWSGYVPTYTTQNPPINVNFQPTSEDTESWLMKQEAYYNIVGPESYQISATTAVDAVFPIIWVLKSSFQSSTGYYNPVNLTTDYFYYNCSSAPNPTKPTNGKLIAPKGDYVFKMWLGGASLSYLHLGYPAFYGNVTFNINGGPYAVNPVINPYTVSTGPYGNQFGIVSQWTYNNNIGYPYRVLKYQFTSYPQIPVDFGIHFY
jgi:hypothetical protein